MRNRMDYSSLETAIEELENIYQTYDPYKERNKDAGYLEVMALIKDRIRTLKEIKEVQEINTLF